MTILAIIPARGGSKGIPRKNVRMMCGKPLIAWTIEAALGSAAIDTVMVTTDDPEIALVAAAWGAEVPFMRPAELATDDAPGMAPIIHAIDNMPSHDQIMVLQPTSPLRRTRHIDALVAYAQTHGSSSVVSVCEPDHSPFWCYTRQPDDRLVRLLDRDIVRRQDQPPVVTLNGAIYLADSEQCRADRSLLNESTLGFVMRPDESIDIDSPMHWMLAELLLEQQNTAIAGRSSLDEAL
ncbi:acylneuraminate cytidylyltransferase family protein [Sphingomonas lacunae]|uniref:Acylneuraminate cytidylyltransferase family protein n=1 Tax=Sphingomonas lacunae TaxID=2698828 RepID=A0A6M4AWQ8_9SPHN|nr:acylneuraminate cytidylyltransferase family protein [Sphingomonas lacunae]QJQ32762.1 acylneuraminate cytidylyltransferase family protein [Sphingomonas lacunae]